MWVQFSTVFCKLCFHWVRNTELLLLTYVFQFKSLYFSNCLTLSVILGNMKCLRQFTQNEISLFKTSSWLFPHHFVCFSNLYIVPLTEYKPFLILLFLFLSISTCQYAKGKWATSYFQSDPNDRRGQGKPGMFLKIWLNRNFTRIT